MKHKLIIVIKTVIVLSILAALGSLLFTIGVLPWLIDEKPPLVVRFILSGTWLSSFCVGLLFFLDEDNMRQIISEIREA